MGRGGRGGPANCRRARRRPNGTPALGVGYSQASKQAARERHAGWATLGPCQGCGRSCCVLAGRVATCEARSGCAPACERVARRLRLKGVAMIDAWMGSPVHARCVASIIAWRAAALSAGVQLARAGKRALGHLARGQREPPASLFALQRRPDLAHHTLSAARSQHANCTALAPGKKQQPSSAQRPLPATSPRRPNRFQPVRKVEAETDTSPGVRAVLVLAVAWWEARSPVTDASPRAGPTQHQVSVNVQKSHRVAQAQPLRRDGRCGVRAGRHVCSQQAEIRRWYGRHVRTTVA